jgi:outer membrane receptor for Fe3+-dicitrate
VDNFNIGGDWGRSDDDQRHRLVATASISTPTTPSTTVWQRLTHGFEVSGLVQVYSALPFNITTGANTVQATAARPIVDGVFIERNAGVGGDFSTVNLRVSRSLRAGARAHVELLLEVFNVFNRRNDIARVTVFGTGAYPTNPAANFGQVTIVGDPREAQLGLRVRF